ncbi:MAG: hypothetical protein K6C33_08085 [Desulfovibrio sp.]|nr:hypothetical protein [Desulfovibrio sp.]
MNPDTGKKAYRLVHWGTVDEKLRFHPNARFLLASEEERTKLIFPENWDLSEIKVQCGFPEVSKMLSVWQSDNRLYGNSWLFFEIAKITGVYEDLCIVFKDRLQYVNIILTIVFHLIIENSCCCNIEQWQRIQKLPCDDTLTADFIAGFIRSITKEHKEEMFGCRAVRLKQEEVCVVCLTSDSTYCHSFGDIKF